MPVPDADGVLRIPRVTQATLLVFDRWFMRAVHIGG